MFVSFARRLAGDGHPVLRFDYMGNGDSDGEFSDSRRWRRCGPTCAAPSTRCGGGPAQPRSACSGFGSVRTIASLVADDVAGCRPADPVGADRRRRALHAGAAAHQPDDADGDVQGDPAGSRRAGGADAAAARPSTSTATRWRTRCISEVSAIKLAAAPQDARGPCLIAQIDRQPGAPAAELQQLAAGYAHGDARASRRKSRSGRRSRASTTRRRTCSP